MKIKMLQEKIKVVISDLDGNIKSRTTEYQNILKQFLNSKSRIPNYCYRPPS
jgi:hypothetical protein